MEDAAHEHNSFDVSFGHGLDGNKGDESHLHKSKVFRTQEDEGKRDTSKNKQAQLSSNRASEQSQALVPHMNKTQGTLNLEKKIENTIQGLQDISDNAHRAQPAAPAVP
jgi:hypothetical protein